MSSNRDALRILVLAATPVVSRTAIADPALCPKRAVGANEPTELLVDEGDFTLDKAIESVQFLRVDFSKRLWGPSSVADLSRSSENYISYTNSLLFIEGALLKQEALRLRAEANRFSNEADAPAAKAAGKAFEQAKAKFCAFVAESMYVD